MLLPRRLWKGIKGYEGKYQVSNIGEVRSLNYNHTGKAKKLKQGTDKDGYKTVGLCNNGKEKFYKVHRLVANTFIPNPNNLPQVNHINEVKDDNRVSNLEWCDCKYNNNYGNRTSKASKKTICLNTGEIFNSVREAGRKYNIVPTSITKCCRGEYKSAGKDKDGNKLIWKYLD